MNRKIVIALALLVPGILHAAEIRLYSIDKFGRQDDLMLWGKGQKPGCHNFRKTREIYRVAVIGKGACALYSEADCAPHSKLAAQWKNRKKRTTLLTPGSRWLFGEKEKIVEIQPEVDVVKEKKIAVDKAPKEQPDTPASADKTAITKVEEHGYKIIDSTPEEATETGPRYEGIQIPLTIGVRSWQCVEKY